VCTIEEMEPVRLQKFLADAGVASRRAAEALIAAGRVSVDGKIVKEMGVKVGGGQKIAVGGQLITAKPERVIYAFHKPRGVVSTVSDPHAGKTIADFFSSEERVYPVGRLDKDSEGLILVTNDGGLAHELMHPKHEHEKEYEVLLSGAGKPVSGFERSHRIKAGKVNPMQLVEHKHLKNGHDYVRLVLHEGKKRQIREVAELLGYKVMSLMRVRIGSLRLGNLPPGKWKKVDRRDIIASH